MRVKDDSMIRCQWCQGENTAKEWNDLTYSDCKSREMRRAFRNIKEPKAWEQDAKFYYRCPCCSQWLRGDQLILLDNDGEPVRGIGGSPIIQIKKRDED